MHRIALTVALSLMLSACPAPQPGLSTGHANIDGAPYGESFDGASAAYKVIQSGAASVTVLRIAPRSDVCEALIDPTDSVDPSLIFTFVGTQAQSYDVVGLDYTGPADGSAPPPTVTVTLQTHRVCDGGAEDSGPACSSTRSAEAGRVRLDAVEDEVGGLAEGAFAADFGEGGVVTGDFRARWCSAIR